MITRRPLFACVCGVLAAVALFALPSASASAAGAKVLLLTRTEEANGPPATQGETAHVTNSVRWPELGMLCGGTEEAATLGKNPAATVKVTGTAAPVPGACFLETEFKMVPGGVAVKMVSVAKTGVVKLTGRLEVTAGECSYRATKLTGTQAFGEEQQFFAPLTGTAKRVAPSAKSCAKTTPVEDGVGVANAEGFNYVVELTG